MELTYIGHSCFKIKTKEVTLVVDPYDPKIGYKLPKLNADAVLVTHNHFDHNNVSGVSNYRLVINSPGEYEIGGVFITGIPSFHDNNQGAERGPNTIYVIETEDAKIVHLGDLGHMLTKDMLEKLGNPDIVLTPVGGVYTIDSAVSAKLVTSLEPSVVVPMHFNTPDLTGVEGLAPVDNFLKEMGAEDTVVKQDVLKVDSRNVLGEDLSVILLTPKH